jgi:hypothetical protein
MQYLDEFIMQLKMDDVYNEPCSEEDINKIKGIVCGKKLPRAYIEFMSAMGNGGRFMKGHSCFMNEIFTLKQGAEELLEENNFCESLTDNDFVFFMSQGCLFCFFKLDEGDNPPVYYYNEASEQTKFYRITDSFSEFLMRFYDKYDSTLLSYTHFT